MTVASAFHTRPRAIVFVTCLFFTSLVFYWDYISRFSENTSGAPVPYVYEVYSIKDCEAANQVDFECKPSWDFCHNTSCLMGARGEWKTVHLDRDPVSLMASDKEAYSDDEGGFWAQPSKHVGTSASGPPVCTNTANRGEFARHDKSGTFVWKQLMEEPSNGFDKCEFQHVSRQEALDCLSKRRIVFVGASLIRQLFLRTIGFWRGERVAIEHYFHEDAHYFMDDQSDCFSIGPLENTTCPSFAVHGAESKRTLELIFIWSPSQLPVERIQYLRPYSVVTLMPTYWGPNDNFMWPSQVNETSIRELFEDLSSGVQKNITKLLRTTNSKSAQDSDDSRTTTHAADGFEKAYGEFEPPTSDTEDDCLYAPHRVFWLDTPPWPKFGQPTIQRFFNERNERFRKHFAENGFMSDVANCNLRLISLASIAEAAEQANILRCKQDRTHYGCGWNDLYPEKVTRITNYKSPQLGQCEDFLNLNVQRMIFSDLCASGTS